MEETSLPGEELPLALRTPKLRSGKWTMEEELYVEQIVADFEAGTLDVPEGTRLRSYLSKVLNCEPMRITKKFTRHDSIGKRVFVPLVKTKQNESMIEAAQKKVEDLRKFWIKKLIITEQWKNRKKSPSYGSESVDQSMLNNEKEISFLASAVITYMDAISIKLRRASASDKNVEEVMRMLIIYCQNQSKVPSCTDVERAVDRKEMTVSALYAIFSSGCLLIPEITVANNEIKTSHNQVLLELHQAISNYTSSLGLQVSSMSNTASNQAIGSSSNPQLKAEKSKEVRTISPGSTGESVPSFTKLASSNSGTSMSVDPFISDALTDKSDISNWFSVPSGATIALNDEKVSSRKRAKSLTDSAGRASFVNGVHSTTIGMRHSISDSGLLNRRDTTQLDLAGYPCGFITSKAGSSNSSISTDFVNSKSRWEDGNLGSMQQKKLFYGHEQNFKPFSTEFLYDPNKINTVLKRSLSNQDLKHQHQHNLLDRMKQLQESSAQHANIKLPDFQYTEKPGSLTELIKRAQQSNFSDPTQNQTNSSDLVNNSLTASKLHLSSLRRTGDQSKDIDSSSVEVYNIGSRSKDENEYLSLLSPRKRSHSDSFSSSNFGSSKSNDLEIINSPTSKEKRSKNSLSASTVSNSSSSDVMIPDQKQEIKSVRNTGNQSIFEFLQMKQFQIQNNKETGRIIDKIDGLVEKDVSSYPSTGSSNTVFRPIETANEEAYIVNHCVNKQVERGSTKSNESEISNAVDALLGLK